MPLLTESLFSTWTDLMKILLTNDDGIDAPGIAALEKVATSLGECVTVAPARHCSGCAHQLTFNRSMTMLEQSPNRYSLDAMPADCVRVAIARFGKFDLVLSGINLGANLGADVYVSGTVAATREATFSQTPAIAISQYRSRPGQSVDWQKTTGMAGPVPESVASGAGKIQPILECQSARRYRRFSGNCGFAKLTPTHFRLTTGSKTTKSFIAVTTIRENARRDSMSMSVLVVEFQFLKSWFELSSLNA